MAELQNYWINPKKFNNLDNKNIWIFSETFTQKAFRIQGGAANISASWKVISKFFFAIVVVHSNYFPKSAAYNILYFLLKHPIWICPNCFTKK